MGDFQIFNVIRDFSLISSWAAHIINKMNKFHPNRSGNWSSSSSHTILQPAFVLLIFPQSQVIKSLKLIFMFWLCWKNISSTSETEAHWMVEWKICSLFSTLAWVLCKFYGELFLSSATISVDDVESTEAMGSCRRWQSFDLRILITHAIYMLQAMKETENNFFHYANFTLVDLLSSFDGEIFHSEHRSQLFFTFFFLVYLTNDSIFSWLFFRLAFGSIISHLKSPSFQNP